jgi:hypothetical protein
MHKNTKVFLAQVRLPRLVAMVLGLVACAAPTRNAESRPLRSDASGYQVEVLVDGRPTQTYWHDGETFALGRMGDRYTIRVSNRTGRRVEAVVSVDGRDVIDGKPGDFAHKRGYLVPAWGEVEIDGWRLSQWQAAAFRFSSVADSYAGRMGNARNVGVVGVAIFPERIYRPRPVIPTLPYRDDYRAPESLSSRGSVEDEQSSDKGAGASASRQLADRTESAPAPAAKSAASESMAPRRSRPGLGTEFGEAVGSQIHEVEFVRANPGEPSVVLGLRYNDRQGLVAMGIEVDGCCGPDENSLRRSADPFPVSHNRFARPPRGWAE